ncbi:hypothetical protein GO755_19230 [Spirosoma sp. HMF4905]|uniref:Uncharacterized protein n=1 Tax=Spirosoma arboris TaxID=2682092 RepID=A0A7K1SEG5_9BACT|nr:DUF6886 family protein [Spirosoma arboris]MVM32189.1 hypothetical protein [Spirosoma arboris]
MTLSLFHVSEEPDITCFVPRPAPSTNLDGSMVWAIDNKHLHNYLLPRDCPRITFYALPESQPEHVSSLLAGTSATYVIAIETCWLERVLQQSIYVYELPTDTFIPLDTGAGYYISRETVTPVSVSRIDNLVAELFRRDIELRVMPSLWKLHYAVIASSLQFSIIRMRNAQPHRK